MIDLNTPAPNFTLNNQADQPVSLSDFNGKWLVLYFYPKDSTPGCTTEACDFTARLADYNESNAVILGVSPDSTASHRKFIDKYQLGITLLSDPDKSVMKAYGAWGMKKNYGREYEGVIRSTFIIAPDGTIVAVWDKVKVRVKRKSGEIRHINIVKERLQELQS